MQPPSPTTFGEERYRGGLTQKVAVSETIMKVSLGVWAATRLSPACFPASWAAHGGGQGVEVSKAKDAKLKAGAPKRQQQWERDGCGWIEVLPDNYANKQGHNRILYVLSWGNTWEQGDEELCGCCKHPAQAQHRPLSKKGLARSGGLREEKSPQNGSAIFPPSTSWKPKTQACLHSQMWWGLGEISALEN